MTHSDPRRGSGEDDARDLERLRELLTGPERAAVERIVARLDDPETRADELSGILAAAVRRASARGDDLGRALAPTVESSLQLSIRRDPAALVDAISPIMGPAIRRSILQAIGDMVQSVNQTVEHSFTIKGLRWRLEAWRSGTSFGEVVALKTLRFQVEQVFLIHRETGLLLGHRSVWPSSDPDLVGSMLVAIRDFVSDSFSEGGGDSGSLDTVQVGERTLVIESGRDAIIAALVRGSPPEVRETLQRTLAEFELGHTQVLADFDGDTQGLEGAELLLGECLLSRSRGQDGDDDQGDRSGVGPTVLWGAAGLVLLLAVAAVAWDRVQFNDAMEHAGEQPGWVVLEGSAGLTGWTIEALRDPLAAPADQVFAAWDRDVEVRTRPYESADAALVLTRVEGRFGVPEAVRLTVSEGVLGVTGDVDASWAARVRADATLLSGIERVEFSGGITASAELVAAARELEGFLMSFQPGSRTPDAGALARLVGLLEALDARARDEDRALVVDVVGSADPTTGDPQTNQRLAEQRARAIVDALGSSWRHITLVPVAAVAAPGGRAPATLRSVRFEITQGLD